jgi:N-formylglutamate deformylase
MKDRIVEGVYKLHAPQAPLVPAVFDSPHSGLHMPDEWRCMQTPEVMRGSGVDNFIDEIFQDVPKFGAPLLEALYHRAFIDPNRSAEEIDLALLDAPWPGPIVKTAQAERGRGVVWRTSTPSLTLYDRKLSVKEMQTRIATYWQPYQDTMKELMDNAHARFGVAYHLDCHSNRAHGTADGPDAGQLRPEMELGTLDGKAASADYIRFVKETLEQLGYQVVVDGFHKGQHLVKAYGAPAQGRHSIMLEIRKDMYMDQPTLTRNARFDECRTKMAKLAEAICSYAKSHAKG